jgi:hypothetical protein
MKEHKKRSTILKTVAIIFVIALIVQSFFYIIAVQSQRQGKNISGLAMMENLSLSPLSTQTRIIIGAQWMIVIIIIIVSLVKGRLRLEKDLKKGIFKAQNKFKKEKPETDLDILYEMLKEDKVLRMTAISKIFRVPKETAIEWCKILESGELAEIRYPTVGDPKIVLSEKTKIKDEKED